MINANVKWKVDPVQALTALSDGIKRKCLRIALNAGAAPMKAAVIAQAPTGKGNLKKSIRIKIKNYRNNNTWAAVIGASKSYKKMRKLKNKKRDRGGNKEIRPAKYQPIVNREDRFMEAALRSARNQFESNFKRKLTEVIQQEINKKH